MKLITKIFFLFFLTCSSPVISDEIIHYTNGNNFQMKDDWTIIRLPQPKPGNKYVIQKKTIKKKIKKYF